MPWVRVGSAGAEAAKGQGSLWGLLVLVLIPERAGLTAELSSGAKATSCE